METTKKKADSRKFRIGQEEYLRIFRTFSRKRKMQIAEEINKELLVELWEKIDADLPNIPDSDEMILEEIKTVRYGIER